MRSCRYFLSAAGAVSADTGKPYDAVVIGGGVAGCMIAGRLGLENLKTLVLEEGCDVRKQPEWHTYLPASLLAHRVAQRGYEHADTVTTPQTLHDGSKASVCIPSPKVLGGRGVMGSRAWNLGDARDWDGTPYQFREDLLPSIRALENMEVFVPHRGKRGRFLIGRPTNFSPHFKIFCEAASQEVPLLTEFTKPSFQLTEGCGRPDVFVDYNTGRAHTTLQRYLTDTVKLNRPLTVQCNTKVVGIRGGGGDRSIARGVTYMQSDGQLVDIDASLVVIAAGAIGSAKLLGASRGSIAVDDSVGTQFWDKPQVVLQYRTLTTNSHNSYFDPLVRAYLRTDLRRGSPLNCLRSSWDDLVVLWSSTGKRDSPDIEFVFQPFTLNSDGTLPLPGEHGCQLLVRLLRPKSRGVIKADGSIDPGYLTDPADAEAMRKGVAYARDVLMKKSPFAPLLGPLVAERFESSGVSGGSCSTAIDPLTFQLKGTANVYVCGDSIIPTALSGSALPYSMVLADKFLNTLLKKKDIRKKTEDQPDGGSTRIIY